MFELDFSDDFFFDGDVGLNGQGIAPLRLHFVPHRCTRFGLRRRRIVHHHARAFRRERPGHPSADAAARARHHCHTILESCHTGNL